MASQDRPASFLGTLAQLQLLHDDEVSHLTAEVTRLRAELEGLRFQDRLSTDAQQVVVPRPNPSPWPAPTMARKPAVPEAQQQFRKTRSIDSKRSRDSGSDTMQVSVSRTTKHSPSSRSNSARALAVTRTRRTAGDLRVWHESWINALQAGQINSPSGWRGRCHNLVESRYFEVVVSVFITLNAVCVGVESSFNRRDLKPPEGLRVLEWLFTAVYIFELAMRLAGQSIISALRDRWIQFDVFFVICGLLDVVLSEAIAKQGAEILDKAMLIRTLRLARLTRFIRYLIDFQTLWLLVQGMLNSLAMLFWTGLVTCILLYVFSVLSMDLMRPDPAASDAYNHIANSHFDSIPSAMLTLLQGLTLDSFSSIYRPIILEKPAMVLYFVPFLLVVSIACMNLVTALMVNLSLEQATQEKQAQEQRQFIKKAAMVELLKEMFSELDVDGSGHIELTEMTRAPAAVQTLILEITDSDCTQASERPYILEQIFCQLDFDDNGSVEVNEFCEGLLKFQTVEAPELFRILKRCHRKMSELMDAVVGGTVSRSVQKCDSWAV